MDLPVSAGGRLWRTLSRGTRRHCPYCGGGDIFDGWFTLKDRCPSCETLFAAEDGYFLGSYVINLVLTSLIALAVVLWMIIRTDMSVIAMQVAAVILAVGLPPVLYPYTLSLWMTLDMVIHPPGNTSRRNHT